MAGSISVQRLTDQVLGHLIGGKESNDDPIDSLSDRQLEVLRLIGSGLNAALIADQLGNQHQYG